MFPRRLSLVICLLLGLAAPVQARPEAPIWQYRHGGATVLWTRQDLVVLPRPNAKPALSMRHDFLQEYAGQPDLREVESAYQVVSAVGPVVTVQKRFYADAGGAHPTAVTTYEALDLRAPRQPALLTDYFPDRDVLKALLADGLVKKALATLPFGPPPRTSLELASRLAEADPDCATSFHDEFLCAFAFHHVEGDRVAVRIGLPHGAEACRGNLTQLGLLLPIPAKLKADLKAAQTRRSGFLARDGMAVHKGASTLLRHAPRPR